MLNTVLMVMLATGLALASGCASDARSASDGQDAAVSNASDSDPRGGPPVQPVSSTVVQHPLAASENPPQAQGDAAPGANDYRIGAQDLLDIQVFGVAELSRTVRVNSRGLISLPLIGLIKAAGLTSEELETQIAGLLTKDYLQNPQVSVFIKEYTSQRVTVEGAVKKPGVFPIKGRTTLLQAIALAEGLGDYASADDIKLFRTEPSGKKTSVQFSLDDIRSGASVDPLIQDDDVVVVQKSTARMVIKEVTDTLRGFVIPFAVP